MNASYDLARSLRRSRRPSPLFLAAAPAGLASLSLLVSACGGLAGSHVAQLGSTTSSTQSSAPSTASAGSAQQTALAFSRCMRSNGVPNFPDPDSQGHFPLQSSASDQAKQAPLPAQNACKHLLPNDGGGGGDGTRGAQQKLAFALKTARCMRSHGFATYPDPTTPSPSSQGSGTRFDGTGIDIRSPRFQTAETNCEKQVRKVLGLP